MEITTLLQGYKLFQSYKTRLQQGCYNLGNSLVIGHDNNHVTTSIVRVVATLLQPCNNPSITMLCLGYIECHSLTEPADTQGCQVPVTVRLVVMHQHQHPPMHLFISEPWKQSVANNIQKFKVLIFLACCKQSRWFTLTKIPQSLKKSSISSHGNFDRFGHLQ